MIEQALRSFCEAKHRTPIVIAGTFVVGLVLVLPLVDVLRNGHTEKEELLSELDSANHVAETLDRFESRVTERLAQLEVIEARTVPEESVPALRTKLVDMAKETGCSIRRLSVGAASSRPWVPGDNAITPAATDAAKLAETNSGFQLEWRPISVSLSGTSSSLRTMLERIGAAQMLMHAKVLELYPSSPNRQTLTLDMELWYFNLARRG